MTHGASRAWGAATFAAVVVGTAGAFATLPTPDVTWLLHVAGVVLDGGRLGVDVVENSPPVILWLKVPAVLLARATGWDSWLVWIGAVSLLAAASVWACGRLLRSIPSLAGSAALLQAVVAVSLFLLPREEFGQREHVTVCLVLPWLLVVAAWAEDAALPSPVLWAASLAGGLGLGIKPHFGLVWLGLAAVTWWRARSPRTFVRPELAAPVLVVLIAAAATLVLHPDWLPYARQYGPLYARFERANPLWVSILGEGAEWSWLGLLALLAFAPAATTRSATWSVLAAALVGFHLAAALQMKGWSYHFLPAGALGLFAAAAAGAGAGWRGDRLVGRVYGVAVPVAVWLAAWAGLRRAVELVAVPETKWAEADPSLPMLLSEVRRSGRRETLLVLSTNIGSGWPLTHLAGAEWTLRHPSLWMLAAIHAEELRHAGVVRTRPPAGWIEEEGRMLDELRQDIARRPPSLVTFLEAAPDAPRWDVSRRFDYLASFRAVGDADLRRCLEGASSVDGAYQVRRCPGLGEGVGVGGTR